MKQRYSNLPPLLAFFLLFYLPTQLYAQCLCSGGAAPQTLMYNQAGTIAPSTDSTDFFFPKFDPTTGVLACVTARAYVTSVVRMRLENDEIFDVYNYRIRYQRAEQLFGPGITTPIGGTLTKNYGPYFLAATDGTYFSGADFMTLGPDTVYKNKLFEGTTSDVVDYLGTGNIMFTYRVVGATIVTGSSNYIFSISATDRIDLELVYSYCPTGLLPVSIKDFNASKKSSHVALSWAANDESPNTRYQVEVSEDASEYRNVASRESQGGAGRTTKYEYQYPLSSTSSGRLYFRVKQILPDGKFSYSAVKMINLTEQHNADVQIYPNPARRKVAMQFDKAQSGDFKIELTNLAGQVVLTKNIRLTNQNTVNLDLDQSPASGVYYLRARDLSTNKTYGSKVIIQQ